ncbi:MAG: hypothetical protein AMXMBFR75_30240 [Candidatus Hinthialibacteria bacterium]
MVMVMTCLILMAVVMSFFTCMAVIVGMAVMVVCSLRPRLLSFGRGMDMAGFRGLCICIVSMAVFIVAVIMAFMRIRRFNAGSRELP